MGQAGTQTRYHRIFFVDVHNEATSLLLLGDGKALVACVLAWLLALGCQLVHKATCPGGGGLPRHAHSGRVRLGGLSGERCAVLSHLSPLGLSRLVCAIGHPRLVTVLTRCGLPLPVSVLADEKPSRYHPAQVSLPTMVRGRVLWYPGYPADASAVALPQSDGEYPRAASQQEPAYRVRGLLTAGVDRTVNRRRTLCPGARLGTCLRHALTTLPGTLMAIASPVRTAVRSPCHTLGYRARQHRDWRVCALGQRLRRCVEYVTTTAGAANGARVRRWLRDKQAGWSAVLADPQMPVTSTRLDQAHHAMERNLVALQGVHHPGGSQQAFLTGLAHLSNLIPYQRRAQHACDSTEVDANLTT